MYIFVPFIIICTINLLALSVGWNPSQNTYLLLSGHKFENGVQRPKPLYGPCPQHAIFDVSNPIIQERQKTTEVLEKERQRKTERDQELYNYLALTKCFGIGDEIHMSFFGICSNEDMFSYLIIEV